jgi:hypothetical protein
MLFTLTALNVWPFAGFSGQFELQDHLIIQKAMMYLVRYIMAQFWAWTDDREGCVIPS